jgi:hypothetical protein
MSKKHDRTGLTTALVLGVAALVWGAEPSAATAQSQSPPVGQSEPLAPSGAPKPPLPSAGSSTPSDNLSRSGGVIQPPAVADPGMARPAPNPGAQSTPVIPPPGSPGGSTDVIPK